MCIQKERKLEKKENKKEENVYIIGKEKLKVQKNQQNVKGREKYIEQRRKGNNERK